MDDPFDNLNSIKGGDDDDDEGVFQGIEIEGENKKKKKAVEEPEEGQDEGDKKVKKAKIPKATDNTKQWDFRFGKIPEGVTIVGGDTQLEQQKDKSTALVIPPNSSLNLTLNLPPNHGKLINDYTLVMDIKLDSLPAEGISLFQANWAQETEGEAFISKTGGVGIFGEYGVQEAWIKPKKWTRVVIVMGGRWGSNRVMTTYVNSKPCASVNRGVFQAPDGRFAITPDFLGLFRSSKETFMPGIRVKYIEFRPSSMTKQEVQETAYQNRVYSFWEIEKEENERKMMDQLSLQPLYKRPPPVWVHPTFLGAFGDAFLEGTGLDGGSLSVALAAFSLVFERCIKEQRSFMNGFEHDDFQHLDSISELFKDTKDLARKLALAARSSNQMVHFMRKFGKLLESLKEGEILVVPGSVAGTSSLFILEKESQGYRFVLVNTDPLRGLDYHQATATNPPKIKYKTCMALYNIPIERAHDDTFWAILFAFIGGEKDYSKFYDFLLPFLLKRPLEAALVESQNDPFIDWKSPQRSSTSYIRVILHALHYLLRRKGLTIDQTKQVSFAVRLQLIEMARNDLSYISSLSLSDVRLIRLACEQLAYVAVKNSSTGEKRITSTQLAEVKRRIDEVETAVKWMPCEDKRANIPPSLELDDGNKIDHQWGQHPFFERLLRIDDVDGLAGLPIRLPKYVPVDLLQIPCRVSNFEDALAAIRYCDKMCTLISVQAHTIKNINFLKCALIEHTFTQVVPVPKSRHSPEYGNCVWATPLRYALQLDILILLQRLIEHFVAAAFSLQTTRSFDAVRIIVPACMAAIADAVIRKKATDIPSEVSLHIGGHLKNKGFGLSTGKFGRQSETIEVHTAELNIARTAVLDYFALQIDEVPLENQIFCWENGNQVEESTCRLLSNICTDLAFDQNTIEAYVSGEQYLIIKNYPEFACFRDIAFYFKYFMNTEEEAFPPPGNYIQRDAYLRWKLDDGFYQIISFGQMPLFCRPRKKPFTHRFPSTATPATLTDPPSKTEDDVLHIMNLPSFDNALGQSDSELLISYLTVPYLRIPLVATFFATEDRIHALKSNKLQDIFDSVLFEPGRYLPADTRGEPIDVPTTQPHLLATPYGMLINELHRSPTVVLESIIKLLRMALELDTGTVFSSTVDIILYVVRVAARVENYVSFMIDHALGKHESVSVPLRDVIVTPSVLAILQKGREELQQILRSSVQHMLEDWCHEAMGLCQKNPDDIVVDQNTRICCNIHAHIILLYRNVLFETLSEDIINIVLSSFIFLTIRHTWNMKLLSIPETELYELLQVTRRKIIAWIRKSGQRTLNQVMEATVRVSTGTGIRTQSMGDSNEIIRKWAFISGDRSIGRFTVISSKHQGNEGINGMIETVDNETQVGIEIDLQIAQLTLKSSHLKALDKAIANNPDVKEIFGVQSMQAATVESAQHREWVHLVGRNHDLQFWKTPDPRSDLQILDRDYIPGELEETEEWIVPIFEPVRLTYLMQPFPLQICLPEKALPAGADVAYMVGIHPQKGGTWKEIFVFKTLQLVQIYNVMSHGRRFYRSLEYTNDTRVTLRDMQPSTKDRQHPWPKWERHGAGHPYAEYPDPTSVVITRLAEIPANLSGTEEMFIPSRLLYGIIPSALLDAYHFWQDKKDNLRGYPINGGPHIIHVELLQTEKITPTLLPGVTARITRIPLKNLKGEVSPPKRTKTIDEEELTLLNVLYAPKGTKLHSLANVLKRIENLSYVLAWTKEKDFSKSYNIDLVELPRLNISFQAQKDEKGITRLYSLDHVSLFIANIRSELTTKLIAGIPHSLLLSNANNEIMILVPSIHPVRPFIGSSPFSTELVLDRTDKEWQESLDTKYYLYPVHVSLSFLFTPTLASALYLLLLRLLHRDYDSVYRLADTIGTDTQYSAEEKIIFATLGEANGDCHPNAHASRLKINLVTMDSPVQCPWDLTKQVSRYVTKLAHVAATCHMEHKEEMQLIEQCICDVTDPRFDPKKYTVYEITLVKNRKYFLRALMYRHDSTSCFLVPRLLDSGWPFHSDMSVLKTVPRDWQQLTVKYSGPKMLSGVMVLDIISKFWPGEETVGGDTLMLGFLFLYNLFTGSIKCKITTNDSGPSVAILLTQLFADKLAGGFMHSILNILTHNPGLAQSLPKYEDKRKLKNEVIFGLPNDQESVSPLDNLFSVLVPTIKDLLPKINMPQSSWPHLPDPISTVQVPPEVPGSWVLPVLSDYSCSQRILRTIDEKMVKNPKLTIDSATTSSFSSFPLVSVGLDKYTCKLSRKELGKSPVASNLPFDISLHPQAQTEVATLMMDRLVEDMQEYASQQNQNTFTKFVGLLDEDIKKYLMDPSNPSLGKCINLIDELIQDLLKLREHDSDFVNNAIPFITSIANEVPLPESDDAQTRTAKNQFLLKRYCGQETELWLDYLIGSLISSQSICDLKKLNPYFEESNIETMFQVIVGTLLHANRIGHINRALSDARDLMGLLHKARAQKGDSEPDVALMAGLIQKSEALALNVSTGRHYIDQPQVNGLAYDPRFLVFEFTWNIVLRKRQVAMVREFMGAIQSGKSMVKQMIMGQGKTTVVGPLLALMLGDGKSLITQVVPPALLEFSRSIMRSTFSSIMHKRIYTLSFDRASKADSALYNKLVNAVETRGVVISTPTTIKSIMLKFLEMLHMIDDEAAPHHSDMVNDARELARILSLFKDGVLIMDEVDLILHPLKSELNFPIGEKLDLDFHPLRWKLPIHLLDAIFYAERGRMSVGFRESSRAVAILEKIKGIINEGYKVKALQRNPHIVLLDPDFYHDHLKPAIVDWLILWLESQHLTGLSEQDMILYVLEGATNNPRLAGVVNNLSPKYNKMLNLARDWLRSFLPHVLQKIDRVSFGLLSAQDFDRAIAIDPFMPRTRAKLAIPFVGKDVPSRSSEFAHPDVIIGLTILAYRYEGLRETDFKDIIANLRSTVTKEVGPYSQRKSSLKYAKWIKEAGGKIKGAPVVLGKDGKPLPEPEDLVEVVPLRLLKRSNQEQMSKIFKLLFKLPDVIHWYLTDFIFPTYMRNQIIKLSESGQALGGDMLFNRRIGFSGTPSDLLPMELGKCGYEKGSDGLMMNYMISPEIVTAEVIEEGWSVYSLLDKIAQKKNPPYHALIDTGALITGISNHDVASYLLNNGLDEFDGVVFLDDEDRKMILVRATGRVVKLAQCGISESRRFAFYDQVHTTGMDIKHVLNAKAVLTLGKDMTFRDYSQGAFRMRGIGLGQTIHLFLIPEIDRLITRELKAARMVPTGSTGTRKVLEDVAAWLVINSMRSERIQFNQLCLQNVANTWRKNAFKVLMENHKQFDIEQRITDPKLRRCMQVFREPIDFSLKACVPVPLPFSEVIQQKVEAHNDLIIGESEKEVVKYVVGVVAAKTLDMSGSMSFDKEQVQEQEQEKEQEQVEEKEQEIEIEKYIDRAYSREEEAPVPWLFNTLMSKENPNFYSCDQFHLYLRRAINFPDYLLVSNNYFNPKWSGERRIKNVVMVLEWLPSTAKVSTKPLTEWKLSALQQENLQKAFKLFNLQKSGVLNQEEMVQAIRSAMDIAPNLTGLDEILKQYGTDQKVNIDQLRNFLMTSKLRSEEDGRWYVVLSLAEAETIRRIMHLRLERPIIDDSDVSIALRCLPAENKVIDASHQFPSPLAYQQESAYQSLRFLNCDTHYKDQQLNVLVRSLQNSPKRERRIFFEHIIGCRRRANRKWEETPLARLFSLNDEFHWLKQRAQAVSMREAIRNRGLMIYDAFRMFDYHRTGLLSPPELYGALEWLGIDATGHDVLDLMSSFDLDRDGNISYQEFLEIVRDPDATIEDMEKENDTQEGVGVKWLSHIERIKPKGEQELLKLKEKLQEEEKAVEIQELEREKQENQQYFNILDQQAMIQNMEQPGGPNPKVTDGRIVYDFTTGLRPYGMTSRGDLQFKTSQTTGNHLKAFKLGLLFLPIPMSHNGGGKLLNSYTATLEIMLETLPTEMQAIFSTAIYNERLAQVYVRKDGAVGLLESFGTSEHKIKPKRWHILTLTVDVPSSTVKIFLDGNTVSSTQHKEIGTKDGRFAVNNQVCIFGSKDPAESQGGCIKSFFLEDHVLSIDEVQTLHDNVQQLRSWQCLFCTAHNSVCDTSCSVCGNARQDIGWICPVCTFKNGPGDTCQMCDSKNPEISLSSSLGLSGGFEKFN